MEEENIFSCFYQHNNHVYSYDCDKIFQCFEFCFEKFFWGTKHHRKLRDVSSSGKIYINWPKHDNLFRECLRHAVHPFKPIFEQMLIRNKKRIDDFQPWVLFREEDQKLIKRYLATNFKILSENCYIQVMYETNGRPLEGVILDLQSNEAAAFFEFPANEVLIQSLLEGEKILDLFEQQFQLRLENYPHIRKHGAIESIGFLKTGKDFRDSLRHSIHRFKLIYDELMIHSNLELKDENFIEQFIMQNLRSANENVYSVIRYDHPKTVALEKAIGLLQSDSSIQVFWSKSFLENSFS